MMQHLLKPPKGARKPAQRVGRGDSAGQGSTCGRGQKGQNSRASKGPHRGFEGGQLPIIKGLPMRRGFTNNFRTQFAIVDLGTLDQFDAGERVTPQALVQRGYLNDLKLPIKVLGSGELSKSVTVVAHRFTRSAREKIAAAGGQAEELA
ncbi:MAG: 50S ribosomal protein L15 [Dehalococcoidia bacterium]|nr:50S ribosomal protein L15 [Dehalococcoidia bacterium]MSQ17607.1 50S ribosomal protein L15 [Dehalococcoidia bacterium]